MTRARNVLVASVVTCVLGMGVASAQAPAPGPGPQGPGRGGFAPVQIGPPAPVPPEVAIPRPTDAERATVNAALKQFIEANASPAAPLLKKYESLLVLQPSRLNVAATFTQTAQRQGPRHEGFVERARQGDGISFGGLEARIGPAVETAPLARMKGIKRVGFAWAYLKTVPDALLSLTDLRALSLDDNDLKSLPDGLARLTKLEELSLSSNRIAEFPEVITRLTALKVLEFGQSETKPKLRGLPESIGKLVNLEKLDLHGQALGELPEALLTLPKLKEIDLTGVTIDAARKREVVAALKARRVKVSA